MAAAPERGDVDFFGVSVGGGSRLTREGIARAARNEPPTATRLPTGMPTGTSPEESDGGEEPVEALGMSELGGDAAAGGTDGGAIDKALDALFAEPNFDDVDDLPPPI